MKNKLFLLFFVFLLIFITGCVVETPPPDINIVAYAGMWNYSSNSSAWTFSINDNDVYYNFTGLISDSSENFNFTSEIQENGGSYLTVNKSGVYKTSFSLSFEGTATGGLYGIGIGKNFEIGNNRNCYARRIASNVAGNVANTCLLNLTKGDNINLLIEQENSPAKDIKIHTVNINLFRIDNN